MALLDPILDKLHDAVEAFNTSTEDKTPAQTDKTNRIISCIKLKIHAAEKSISTKLKIVQDAEKEENAFNFWRMFPSSSIWTSKTSPAR